MHKLFWQYVPLYLRHQWGNPIVPFHLDTGEQTQLLLHILAKNSPSSMLTAEDLQ